MHQTPTTWPGLLLLGLMSLMMAFWMAARLDVDHGIAPFATLQRASGQVYDIQPHRYGVDFRLMGHPQRFSYSGRSAPKQQVINALQLAGQDSVTIWYETAGVTPWLSSEPKFYANQLQVLGSVELRYADHVRRVRADNAFAPWLFAFFGFSGLYFCWQAWRLSQLRRHRFDHLFP